MARRSRKKKPVSLPAMGGGKVSHVDGNRTGRANHMTIVEPVMHVDPETGKKSNPNGVTRRRRVSWVEALYRQGKLTTRQYNAAIKLQGAWERTERGLGGGELKERVQSSPKPDKSIDIQIDRVSQWVAASKCIPVKYELIIKHVVLGNRSVCEFVGRKAGEARRLRALTSLQQGLDTVADSLEK